MSLSLCLPPPRVCMCVCGGGVDGCVVFYLSQSLLTFFGMCVTDSHHATLTDLKLFMKGRLALNSQRCPGLCLLKVKIKGMCQYAWLTLYFETA